ncbi:LuxR C-terminal-related transcriptional regulator [Streptomyces olivochromogenes]|uniref:LuxR C-terminal-related transcriptional regulator n=2 Tax=Streptomyces TaxID=1883 RepID=UPI001F401B2C|nr:LuxR C-terminal-related transcriptional regulator [Streptomyces olivochromogenes]MCF3134494.1 helix-turn-helix domain-containing protein [Streptomyces olivochromogenes]
MCREKGIEEKGSLGSSSAVHFCTDGLRRYREALDEGTISGEVPECLISYGLLRPVSGVAGFFVPIPPRVAEAELSRSVVREIEHHEKALATLRSSYVAAESLYHKAQQDTGAPIESLYGTDVISQSLGLAVESCREELLTAQPGGGRSPALLAEALPRDLALVRRGVAQRTLYQHSVRSHQPTLAYIERVTAEGAEVRTLDEIFERVIICDRTVAFIPGSPERRTAALAVRHPGAVAFLVKVFDHMWERGRPVSIVPEQHRPDLMTDSVRATMLRMVVTGHTDETIAARLGVSSRTVSAHIKKVSELLGSRSRAELGYLISQRRLLEQGQLEQGQLEQGREERAAS